MATLIMISIVSAASVAFFIYVGVEMWRDSRRPVRRMLVLRFEQKIIRNKPRVLHMIRWNAIRTEPERSKRL